MLGYPNGEVVGEPRRVAHLDVDGGDEVHLLEHAEGLGLIRQGVERSKANCIREALGSRTMIPLTAAA